MNYADCENLDAFLSDDLSSGEMSRFAAHLDACDDCREAVHQQQWIDGLLRSPLIAEVEAPAVTLLTGVRSRQIQRRRQVNFIACGLAAAAAVVIAVGWTIALNLQADGTTAAKTASVAIARVADEIEEPPPRATFVGGPDVLVVPLESRHPNVTVVRVYPAYQPGFSTQANTDTASGMDEFALPDDFNGG